MKNTLHPIEDISLSEPIRTAFLVAAARQLLDEKECEAYLRKLGPVDDYVEQLVKSTLVDPIDQVMYALDVAKQYTGMVIELHGEMFQKQLYVARLCN